MKLLLPNDPIKNQNVRRKLHLINRLSYSICEGFDQDRNFCFVENIFFSGNTILFNIMCHEKIKFNMDFIRLNAIKAALLSNQRLKIKCSKIICNYIKHEIIYLTGCKPKDDLSGENSQRNINSGEISEMNESNYNKSTSPKSIDEIGTSTDWMNAKSSSIEMDVMNVYSDTSNCKDWNKWTITQVSDWFESILRRNNNINDDTVDLCMIQFNRHGIDGETLQILKQFPDEYKTALKIAFATCSLIMWIEFDKAIKLLPQCDGDKLEIQGDGNDGIVEIDGRTTGDITGKTSVLEAMMEEATI